MAADAVWAKPLRRRGAVIQTVEAEFLVRTGRTSDPTASGWATANPKTIHPKRAFTTTSVGSIRAEGGGRSPPPTARKPTLGVEASGLLRGMLG